jgi:hypothetical protein
LPVYMVGLLWFFLFASWNTAQNFLLGCVYF